MSKTIEPNLASGARAILFIVGDCDVQLWSLSAIERHLRAFARLGIRPALESDSKPGDAIIAVRADYLLGTDLVAALGTHPDVVLTNANGDAAVAVHSRTHSLDALTSLLNGAAFDPADPELAGLEIVGPAELGSSYDNALRRRARPFALPYVGTSLDALERETFGAAYKGATDFVTKWCWPAPARNATRWAAAHGISPNSVTTASLVLVILATWLFAQGHFILAIPIAWAMTFLDTVDGKLARVTLTSSAWGNIYDHGIDLVHPPFWWWAWYVGVLPTTSPNVAPALEPALWVILAGYLLGRLFEGIFVLAFKIETHIWRPVDFFFRTITARRNPNLAILTIATIFGRPDIGFVAVAGWTVVSLLFHLVRLIQAALLKARGEDIVSWLNPTACTETE